MALEPLSSEACSGDACLLRPAETCLLLSFTTKRGYWSLACRCLMLSGVSWSEDLFLMMPD